MRLKFSWILTFCFIGFFLLLLSTWPDSGFAEPSSPYHQNPNQQQNTNQNTPTTQAPDHQPSEEDPQQTQKPKAKKLTQAGKDKIKKRIQKLEDKLWFYISEDDEKDINKTIIKEFGSDYELDDQLLLAIKKEMEREGTKKCGEVEYICQFDRWIQEQIRFIITESVRLFIAVIVIDRADFYGSNETKWYDPFPEKSIFKYQKMMQDLAWAFLGLFLAYQSVRVLAIYLVETNPTELKQLLQRLVVTSILIYAEPYIISALLELNRLIIEWLLQGQSEQEISKKILGALGLKVSSKEVVVVVVAAALLPSAQALMSFLFMILAGTLLIVLLQVVTRYAEIALLAILGPFAIVTNMNKEYNLFSVWWRNLLATIFTVAVQILLLVILLAILSNEILIPMNELGPFTKPLIMLGFLIITIRAPKFLKDWVYNSGTSASALGVARKVATKTIGRKVFPLKS